MPATSRPISIPCDEPLETMTHPLEHPLQRLRTRSVHKFLEVAASKDGRLAAACILSVGGWSLTWAQALLIVNLLPMWSTILAFVVGLAIIPLCAGAGEPETDPIPHAEAALLRSCLNAARRGNATRAAREMAGEHSGDNAFRSLWRARRNQDQHAALP